MVWKDGLLMNPGCWNTAARRRSSRRKLNASSSRASIPKGRSAQRSAGEGSLAATIPAISNAIYDAVGVRLREAPFTPERVLAALRAQEEREEDRMTEGVDPTAPTSLPRTRRIVVVRARARSPCTRPARREVGSGR